MTNHPITRRAALGFGLSIAAGLASCSNRRPLPSVPKTSTGLSIVCTVFPAYDWARSIIGEMNGVTISYLLASGADLHSFQPSVADMSIVASADLLVYVGGESEAWVKDAITAAANDSIRSISLLEVLGAAALEEETVEGMQQEDEPESEEPELDEHVWLSLRNAKLFVERITQELSDLDPDHAEDYSARAQAYTAQLDELDSAYEAAVAEGKYDTLLFGDRFPFRYLVNDYQLNYYAAFAGCSAETEASFETVVFLANKVDELGLPAVLTLENSDKRIAQTIVDNTATKDQAILTLNSLQSASIDDVNAGTTYLGVMKENLNVLKQALA